MAPKKQVLLGRVGPIARDNEVTPAVQHEFCYTPYIYADDVDFPLKMICSLQLPSATHPLMHHPATFQACANLTSALFDAQQLPPAPVTTATFRPSSADWWFTEPLHPVEEPVPDKEESLLPWACTNCSRRFHEG